MRQELGVSEVLQARGVISHHVGFSRDALGHVAVSVLPLVLCREDAWFGGRPLGCDSFLGHTGFGRRVVHESGDGGVVGMSSCAWHSILFSRAGVLSFIKRARAAMEASPHWQFISVDLAMQFEFP